MANLRFRVEDIIEKIDQSWTREGESRAYIGASTVGNDCLAFLQMGLRGYPQEPFPPNVLRIFRDGHRIEDSVVADLKKSGMTVFAVNGLTNKQFEWISFGGHVKAHADGMVELQEDEPLALLEIKSMNDKQWELFKSRGVKSSHKKYYEQMIMMMGMGKIPSALFVSYNKNTSKYHAEVVPYDEIEFNYVKDKIEQTLGGNRRRIADVPDRWDCKFCSRKEVCWTSDADDQIEVLCRTCDHSIPTDDGGWKCTLHKKQCKDACPDWLRLQIEPAP